jgi:hypothetical protein
VSLAIFTLLTLGPNLRPISSNHHRTTRIPPSSREFSVIATSLVWRPYTGSLYGPKFTLQAFLHLLSVTGRYYIHTNESESRDRSKVVQKFVREVLEATDRSPELIQLTGIKDLLEEYINQMAVNQFCENTALETTDGVIKGQVKAAVLNSDLINCYHGVEGRSRGNRFCPWKSISSTSLSSVVA